jgi:hypothetical protein
MNEVPRGPLGAKTAGNHTKWRRQRWEKLHGKGASGDGFQAVSARCDGRILRHAAREDV